MILADLAESECVIMNQQNLWVGNKIEIKLDFLSSLTTYLKKIRTSLYNYPLHSLHKRTPYFQLGTWVARIKTTLYGPY